MILKSSATFVLLIAFLGAPVFGATIPEAKPEDVGFSSERLQRIHQTIERHMQAKDISGAVTIVARRGRIAHYEAQGQMDFGSAKPMTKDTIFRIASMSKPITGVAVMMLVEEGKIRLSDPITKFIPEFRGIKVAIAKPGSAGAQPQIYTVPADHEITVRELLTHTAGLTINPLNEKDLDRVARKPNDTLATYIPRLGTVPIEFQPGTRWSYSRGPGFETLGRLVEIVSGLTFDQFLKQRIFEPLGMKDTFFYPTESQMSRLPGVYRRSAKGLDKEDNSVLLSGSKFYSGSGGLISTAEDYVQFGQMLLNGGQLNGKRLLSPKTVELMTSVHIPDTLPGRQVGRAFGLSMQVFTNAPAAGFSISNGSFGWDGAFGTHFWVDPKEKLVGVLMVQAPGAEVSRDFDTAVMQAIIE